MKAKFLLPLLFAGSCFVARSASAQNNVVKANIFSPMVKTGSFFYERKLNPKSSLQLGGLFTHWNVGDTKVSGFAFTPEYRLYLSKDQEALNGFYVAPFARYQNLSLATPYDADNGTEQTAKASLNTIGGGVVVGRQWIFGEHFSLDMFLGPSYNNGSLKVTDGESKASFDAGSFQGFGIRTGLTFGVAF